MSDAPVSRPIQQTGVVRSLAILGGLITTTAGFRFSVQTVRFALLRAPGGLSGRSWMLSASEDTPLARLWMLQPTPEASLDTARDFAGRVQVGMVGVNFAIPVPLAYHTFGGWRASGFGDLNQHGPDSIRFYTKTKTVTSRWPSGIKDGAEFTIPTMK